MGREAFVAVEHGDPRREEPEAPPPASGSFNSRKWLDRQPGSPAGRSGRTARSVARSTVVSVTALSTIPSKLDKAEWHGEGTPGPLEICVALDGMPEGGPSCGWCARYLVKQLAGQLKIVTAIGVYLLAACIGIHRELPWSTGELAGLVGGVALVAGGLTLFLEGLRLGVMPLGEALGTTLPQKAPLPVILLVALILGIGVTYAEPAIAALQTIGESVDWHESPYLYYVLNTWSPFLVVSVGFGVGIAAVLGTLRYLRGWTFRVPMYCVLSLTLVETLAFHLLAPKEARGIIALAWDCGAVTTGPVTVPIVLALGVGVVSASGREAGPLDSFGLVTLASLLPVVTVLALSTVLILTKDPAQIIAELGGAGDAVPGDAPVAGEASVLDSTPVKQMLDGSRALLPLVAFLSGVLRLGLCERLPRVRLVADQTAPLTTYSGEQPAGGDARTSVFPGIVSALAGLIMFNIGLTSGLQKLGDKTGNALPGLFGPVADVGGSPLMGGGAGTLVALLFTFFLGIGATLAEPALAALGITVDRLTEGRFPPLVVKAAVPFGVACGLVAGTCKVLYEVDVALLVLPLYPIAAALTALSDEELASIAWDSAGVTTGPVTVPLVLALGAGIRNASGAAVGFGLLTMASICPILSVIAYGLVRKYCGSEPTPEEAGYMPAMRCEPEQSSEGLSDTIPGTESRSPSPYSRSETVRSQAGASSYTAATRTGTVRSQADASSAADVLV